MSEAYSFRSGSAITRRSDRGGIVLGIADWISLAAAPTFAILAALTLYLEARAPGVLCSVTQNASPLNSMAAMYVFMGVSHSTPWLKLIAGRGDRHNRCRN